MEQQQQQQQAESQAAQKMDDAKIMDLMAKSQVNAAKVQDIQVQSQERIAKIDDLHASANHKRTQSELDMVKSMLELESIDLDMIGRSWEIAMAIKGQNTAQENNNTAAAGGV